MYFDIAENGKIMVCAETKINPTMIYLATPSDFVPEEMHNWKIIDGEFGYDPLPVPDPVEPVPTDGERITALEQQMTALMGGVADVQ